MPWKGTLSTPEYFRLIEVGSSVLILPSWFLPQKEGGTEGQVDANFKENICLKNMKTKSTVCRNRKDAYFESGRE